MTDYTAAAIALYLKPWSRSTSPNERAGVQLAYPGKLYITDHNSCFKSEVEQTTLILPHSDVTATEKLPSSLDGGTPPYLRFEPCLHSTI